jgi:acyl transferase domain-containing protein
LLVLSARTPTALNAAAQNLVTHFHRRREDNLADIAYTLQVGRQEFAYRQAVVSKTCEEAIECLPCLPLGQIRQGMEDEKGPAVLFLFPGQGTQFVGMGKEIYEEDKLFRHVVDQCCEKLKPFMGIDLRELLYPPESKSEWARKKLQETAITQPAIFVIEYALARLWMQWGIRPQAMLGHSIGEYAAACLAGVIDEDDALRLISLRGRLIQEQPSGSMLVVALSEEECLSELQPGLWLAAANGQRQCVLSGTHEAIEALQKRLESRSVYCHRLQVSHAFHSGMMEPLLKRFAEEVQGIRLGKPCLRYVSSLSGDWMLDQAAIDPQYWVRHLRHTVRFAAGIKTLFDDIPNCVFLEVGPGENLARLVCEESSHHEEVVVASSMPRTASSEGGMAALLRAAGRLWTAGAKLQWHQFHQDEKRSRVPLPVYPFERKHYSISESLGQCKAAANAARTKRPDPADWFYLPVWKQAPFAQAGRQLRGEEWLIFVDDGELGKTLVDLIVAAGHRVLLVKRGEQRVFHQDVFTINPGAREDYVAFVMELKRRKRMPHKILHLWSNPDRKDASKSGLPADVGCLSLLLFSQSLEAQNLSSPIRLIAITADAHQVTGNEDLSPSAASVLGACLVISQEFPNLQCRCIDISIPDFYSPLGSKCQLALIKDFTSDHPDFLTAYRSGQRWVRTFEQIHLQVGCKPSRLREGGVYLITGGLGKIGLKVAEYLSEKVKAKLVLVSRTKLPAQENWEEYLRSHISNTKAYCTLEKLSTLRKLGSEIIVASADVSKIKDVLRVIDETHARFGSIHGVFHAAGHTDPKVTGLRVLQTALAAEPLDFMMFFSSLSAVLGGIGFSAYAAANVFMDSYSYYWRQQGLCPCMSLNWDGWDFAEANGRFSAGNKLAPPILPEEGIQVLNSILYADETYSQVVVSTTDLFKRITEWVEPPHRYKTAPRISALHTVDRAVVTSEYVAPQNSLEEAVAEIWEEMLGISELGIYDNFIQLGGHSLLGMRICTRIRALFEINFTVEHLYESPTIAGITEFITKTLINGLDANQIDGLIKHL